MIVVAICDDEINVGAKLESALIDIFGKLNVGHEVDVFFSCEQLCKEMDSGTHYDLIFLDIQFAQATINGVELGRQIRDVHQNHTTSIVYISWEKNYALQLFDSQPLNFLVKPIEYKMIEDVIKQFLRVSGHWLGEFTYKIGHDIFKVHIKNIVYLESRDRKLIIHFVCGKNEEFYGSIKNVYHEQLKKFDFLFIHNSYVVNYDYVSALKFDEVILCDDQVVLPISKLKRPEARVRYFEIIERRRV